MHPCLTRAFYEHLEHALSGALGRSDDPGLAGCWCDGILDPEWAEDYQPQHVRRTRQLVLRAWIDQGRRRGGGSGEQEFWLLVLELGPQAYAAYLRGRSLQPCVPDAAAADWVRLDLENRVVSGQLL